MKETAGSDKPKRTPRKRKNPIPEWVAKFAAIPAHQLSWDEFPPRDTVEQFKYERRSELLEMAMMLFLQKNGTASEYKASEDTSKTIQQCVDEVSELYDLIDKKMPRGKE